jgi:hypothetical protein
MASLVSGIAVSNGDVVTPAILNANPTLTAGTIVQADLTTSNQNWSLTGPLAVTGAITGASIATTGNSTIGGNQTVTGTFKSTGAATLSGGATVTGTVTATAFSGSLTGAVTGNASTATTATTATNLAGGSLGTVPYQSAAGTTTQLSVGTAGQVLTSNGTAAPSWQTLSATTTNASNLTGGLAGSLPYQSGAGTTQMLGAGTTGQVLISNGAAAPSWQSPASANTASAIVIRDSSGNFSAGTITGALTGNATTATTLATARTISLSGAVAATGVSFNGSANIALTTTISSLQDSSLATISTAGKVSNSATTATSANTASAIVARDSSGNFTAGTITAALSGNASTATTAATATTVATGAITASTQIGSGVIATSNLATTTQAALCKAWVTFDGTNGTISQSLNVSSVTRSSTGKYVINIPSGVFTSAAYCLVASAQDSGTGVVICGITGGATNTTTAASVVTSRVGGIVDPTIVCVQIFGT